MSASDDTLIANVTTLLREGRHADARPLLLRALQRSSAHPHLNHLAARVFARLGEQERAEYFAFRACAHAQRAPEAARAMYRWSLGEILESAGKKQEGVDAYEQAVALEPGSIEARRRMIRRLDALGWFTRASRHARAAFKLAPENDGAFALLVYTLLACGDMRGVLDVAEQVLTLRPDHLQAAMAAAYSRNYLDGIPREETFRAHARVGELVSGLAATGRLENRAHTSKNPERPLRIGILSADFREHSVSYFLEAIMRQLDRTQFTLFCYSVEERADQRTAMHQSLADTWRQCAALDPLALAQTIRSDEIDLLIETSGLTGSNRLEALALKPAPVQVTYCGYANSTGLPAVNYRIVDSQTDPASAEQFHTEELVRLDPCFLCYTPAAGGPEVSPPPFESRGRITFASFNTLLKVTDRVLEVWAQCVLRVPRAGLLLKSQQFADPETIERVLSRMESTGLARERVEIVDFVPTPAEHLALYSMVDIALDPFPYNGTTTVCEAAWMGVPTVTLAGEAHAGRVGASLLRTMGLSELVARDADDYIAKALQLATDEDRLRQLRSGLRERLRTSPLCDGAAFTRRFEGALREMWRKYTEGK